MALSPSEIRVDNLNLLLLSARGSAARPWSGVGDRTANWLSDDVSADHHFHPAVLLPAGCCVVGGHRTRLAHSDCLDIVCADSVRSDVIPNRIRTLLGKLLVELITADT